MMQKKEKYILWHDLESIGNGIQISWVVAGDYNCVLNPDERIGSIIRHQETDRLQRCVQRYGLQDMASTGNKYTSNNKHFSENRVFCKLDRAMINQEWLEYFPTAMTHFLPKGQFDHSPVVIMIYPNLVIRKHPFEYFKMWSSAPNFTELNLKHTKQALKKLNAAGFSEIQSKDIAAYHKMITCQEELQRSPHDEVLRSEEYQACMSYRLIHKSYLAFLSQKAKMRWCKDCDENTALFHESIKARKLQNTIYAINDMNGSDIAQEFKEALFSIPGDKSPWPDGYGTHFFRDAWDILGAEVTQAILDVVHSGKLLTELNATILTLIPKGDPISPLLFVICMENWLSLSVVHKTFQRQIHYIQKSKRTGVQKKFIAAVFSDLVYQIWWVRNEAICNQVVWRPEVVFKKLKNIVQLRIRLVLPKKISTRDQMWIDRKLENI
ncbi:uncharacterized protein LOC104887478 [Beta vulgaris subsp. vulgaris]|uniref:uncharacterized protein LOC104887478 n=1 Tax=Beta vulgaris subsp. vulgaris TaxID=3555 RepID=UPI00053F57DA|nr:uncharacterized protein LOC104887478 [Beta vulgaris subsp. vulgaris]